jgi:hypothetical protein
MDQWLWPFCTNLRRGRRGRFGGGAPFPPIPHLRALTTTALRRFATPGLSRDDQQPAIGRLPLAPTEPVGGHSLFFALLSSPDADKAPYAHGRAAAGPLRSSLRSRPSPISPAPPGKPSNRRWHHRAVVTNSLGWLCGWKAETPANAGHGSSAPKIGHGGVKRLLLSVRLAARSRGLGSSNTEIPVQWIWRAQRAI